MVVHTCITCLKEFKLKTDLERHKNRKNKCSPKEEVVKEIINNTSSNIQNLEELCKLTPPINSISSTTNNNDEYNHNKCINCNKIFTRTDNYNRHVLYRCKLIDKTIQKDDNSVMFLLEKMNNKIEELQNTITELKEQKSSANITNNNTNSNNTTNVTNNNIKIVAFGYENPIEALDDKEIQFIIGSHKNTMIQRSIKTTHFNNRLPQFHNVYIPDKKMQHAITFNGNKPEMKGLEGVIDDLLLTHINNLDDIKNRENVSITEAKAAEIDDVVDNFRGYKDTGSDNQKWIYKKAEREIKEMLYNNKEKVIDTQKRAKKRKGIKV